MAKGIVRRIDELGRITVPIEHRRASGIDVLVPLDLSLNDNTIRLIPGKGRRMDELGRYTIPKEIRDINRWAEREVLEIYVEDGAICIRKYGCEWCPETQNLTEIDNHILCPHCIEKLVIKAKQLKIASA